jgi:glycosyltransferase involved in cell wall biosynthesis
VAEIPFGAAGEGFVLCAARVSPEKGTHLAIEAAAASGYPLALVGGVYDDAYFRASVLPRVSDARGRAIPDVFDERATYLGPRPRADVLRLMARATALLVPVGWDEAFGLTVVEAQAAGSPVVGFRRGALPDVVAEGVTGFLVPPGDVAALVARLADVAHLDRRACRQWVADQFDTTRMLARYDALYADMAAGRAGEKPHAVP